MLVQVSQVVVFLFVLSSSSLLQTRLGKVEGNDLTFEDGSTVYEFLGVRYAIPPIDDLRFKPSQVYNIPYNGIYNATKHSCRCTQGNFWTGVFDENSCEDCLFLNIYTPNIANDKKLAVMVWIHGGAYIVGSAMSRMYNGTLVKLGPLGFLASENIYNEDPSNYPSTGGLNLVLDQITALKWIKRNIGDFGGDKNRVTLFGESAGGVSICYLLVSPLAKGLFNRVIEQSGPCFGFWCISSKEDGLTMTTERLNNLNLSHNISELRKLPPQNISGIEYKFNDYTASVDGHVIDKDLSKLYNEIKNINQLNAQSIIWGFTSLDSGASWPVLLGNHPETDEEFNLALKAYINNETLINEILHYYSPNKLINATIAWYIMNRDCVACPTFETSDVLSQNLNNNLSQYIYIFKSANENELSPHSGELPFLFPNKILNGYYSQEWSDDLSNIIINSWTNFAINGNPSVNNISWDKYTQNNNNILVLNKHPKMEISHIAMKNNNACNKLWKNVNINIRKQLCWNFKTPKSNTKKQEL